MKRTALAAALAATCALAIAVPAEAQTHRGAFGINAGGMWFSALNDDRPEGFDRLGLRPSWVVGTQFEQWIANGRYGFRLNANYAEPTMQISGDQPETIGTTNLWAGNVDVMLRLLSPRLDRTWAPYLSAGFGAVHYNPPGGNLEFEQANAEFRHGQRTQLTPVVALGTDVFTGMRLFGAPMMIRLEAANHIATESPIHRLDTGERYGTVHNVRGTIGIHTLFNRITPPPPVAVVPPPPPPVAVEPAPPPPPPAQ